MPEILKRAAAIKMGLDKFYIGPNRLCGHDAERFVHNEQCIVCEYETKKKSYWYSHGVNVDKLRPRPDHCEICGVKTRLVFDHSHETGEFRGWICSGCNIALGLVHDDVRILEALIKYLERAGFSSMQDRSPYDSKYGITKKELDSLRRSPLALTVAAERKGKRLSGAPR